MYNEDEDENHGSTRCSTPRPAADSQLTAASRPTTQGFFSRQLKLLWVALRTMNVDVVVFLVYCGWAFGNTLQVSQLVYSDLLNRITQYVNALEFRRLDCIVEFVKPIIKTIQIAQK
jgi:hypothetical protein